jgi:N6-L-threonylcarbamoyladenine synthase
LYFWLLIILLLKTPTHTILAIESSCDDTGVSVVRGRAVLSNLIATQEVHSRYGGVVPELASRAHASNIIPTIELAIKDSGVGINDIDAVAYTIGPGLSGSLLVGSSFAKSWAWAQEIPTIPVHHMRAHVLAHFLGSDVTPSFPFLCLTVSGGHTQIVRVDSPYKMEVLGSTLDDAAGEAFDKVAKLIGLPYPGGPLIDKYSLNGDCNRFFFNPSKVDGLNLSFSGFKTQVLRFLQKTLQETPDFFSTNDKQNLYDFCASVQYTIISMLMVKLEKAASQEGIAEIAIAGGVSANSGLREALKKRRNSSGWNVFIPPLSFCTDNAAMVGMVGVFDFAQEKFGKLSDTPSPRLPNLCDTVE